ncbi:MAG TPA: hypothetical protein VE974_29650 [Thermoanaerobaculia bacterium]|nr:hypothetical protein [Thermoanaerobaculia bacterium]
MILPPGGASDDSWALAIQPSCQEAGAYAERLDAALTPDAVLRRMQNLIAKADLMIVDTTQRHENIFYAAGYAHALDKQVILLTGREEDIPFDLKHYPHIVHGGNLPDRAELERRARHLLDAAARGEAPRPTPVEISVNKVALSPDVPREVTAHDQGNSGLWFDVDIRNQTGWRLRAVRLQLGLITPSHYREVAGRGGSYLEKLPADAGTHLYLSRQEFTILPGSWATAMFIAFAGRSKDARESEAFGIRVLTESGYFDFPFTMQWPGTDPPGTSA